MKDEAAVEWQEPVAGFEYRTDTVRVSAESQREKLTACGLEVATFGGAVDPSFFIGLAIRAGIASGISAEGNVNMLQKLIQHRPAELGEPLTVRGLISAVTEVPRGRTIDTDVWFEDSAGARVITASRRSLKPEPGASARGAGERPAPVITDPASLVTLAGHTLTPEQVRAYSEEGNSIHYDLEAARRAGFRAPLIGGGMGVHYLLAALWAESPPERLDLDIYFRRPIFWDASFRVSRSADRRAAGLLSADGPEPKVLTEARINDWG
jgi:hypothetical protein